MSSQNIQQIAIFASCGISAFLMVLAVQDFALRYLKQLKLGHFVGAFLLLRLWAFAVIYLIYGFEPIGDLDAFSRLAMGTSGNQLYGVLFPYLVWLATFGTGNVLLIDVLWILCDCLAFIVGDRLLAASSSLRVVTLYRILYVLCPISWFLVVGLGQDEPLLALMGELTLLATLSSLNWLGGILTALGLALTKVIFGLYGFAGWLGSNNRVLFLFAFLAATLALFAPFWYSGVPPLLGSQYIKCSPSANVWIVLFPNYPGAPSSLWVFPILLVGSLLASSIYARLKLGSNPTFRSICHLLLVNWLVLFLFSPKSLAAYRLAVLPFMLMYAASNIASKKRVVYLLGLYSLSVSIHYSFWEDWVQNSSYFANVSSVFVYVLTLVIVGTEIVVLVDLLKRLTSNRSCSSDRSGRSATPLSQNDAPKLTGPTA